MRRLVLTTTFAAALAIPAAAGASSGVVLSVKSAHHQIQIVDTHHLVHAYGYAGHLPKLHAGTKIGFSRSGGWIRHVRVVSSTSRSVSFYAKVVRTSAHGVVLSLADGSKVSFSTIQLGRHRSKHHKHAIATTTAGISASIQSLEPGVTVLVTETVAPDGSVTITIALPGSSAPGVGSELQAIGIVTEVDPDAFVLTVSGGSDLRLHISADALAARNLQACDTAAVTYHQVGGTLVADTVKPTGTSTAGACAASAGGGAPDDQDVIGAIAQISDTSVTIIIPGQGPMTFQVDQTWDLTDGFIIGDTVDVTYYANGNGTYSADDIEYDDQDTTGTVTAISDNSVTLTDDTTGQPVTFTVNPDDGYLDGVSIGDQVDVSNYLSSGQAVVDWIDDISTD